MHPLSLEDALGLIVLRSRVIAEGLSGRGALAWIALPAENVDQSRVWRPSTARTR